MIDKVNMFRLQCKCWGFIMLSLMLTIMLLVKLDADCAADKFIG